MALTLLLSLGLSWGYLCAAHKLALRFNLLDLPDHRKHHQGAVPLTGGIALALTVISIAVFQPAITGHSAWFSFAVLILAILGLLDDRFDLSCRSRLLVQALLTICMIWFTGLQLSSFGNLSGGGDITLGWFAPLLTVMAVIGAINAFNMVDGIDGLLGGLSIVTITSIAVLLMMAGHVQLTLLCGVIITALIPYLARNLGLIKGKVFMGDTGSMVIGFIVIWLLLQLSQPGQLDVIRPVTALWLIAVPLTDMVAIMIRRVLHGQSPLKPDREHLHHICQRMGLSSKQTLVAICLVATGYAVIGIYGELSQIPESTMFYSFLACFGIYLFGLMYAWRVTRIVRGLKDRKKTWEVRGTRF